MADIVVSVETRENQDIEPAEAGGGIETTRSIGQPQI